uniref:Protein phosphatase 1 regulatory subunit 3C n=2 Tax=Ceratitis capitata TaxID=7213 RepID=W8C3J6_CERCA
MRSRKVATWRQHHCFLLLLLLTQAFLFTTALAAPSNSLTAQNGAGLSSNNNSNGSGSSTNGNGNVNSNSNSNNNNVIGNPNVSINSGGNTASNANITGIAASSSSSSSGDSRNSDAAGVEVDCVNCKCSGQSRCRKRVIFADDEGQPLTEVRVMSEPSNVPPLWSTKFLEQITQGLVSPHPADQWTVDFKQPASDYLTFRKKIDQDLVSLENVIVKDEESIVVGTVKVKNVSFEKEVIVRVTWDDWKNQQDIFCTFARAYGPATYAHVVFDTFSFKITLPPSSKRLEFCICYRANNQEYWDNNDGKNYTITKRSPFYYNALSPYDKNSSRNAGRGPVMSTLSEALSHATKEHLTQNNWSKESGPYWQQKQIEEKYW